MAEIEGGDDGGGTEALKLETRNAAELSFFLSPCSFAPSENHWKQRQERC